MRINTENAVAYPTYICDKAEFEKELKSNNSLYNRLGDNYIKKFNSGIDCSELEKMSCMKAVLPKCLSMINIKTLGGKREAAKILLNMVSDNASLSIPNSILYDSNGNIRIDDGNFKEYYKYMLSINTDWVFGELFGNRSLWSMNCYVADEKYVSGEDIELPVMMLYSSDEADSKLWYIGSDNNELMFMYSTVNVFKILNE